MENEAEIATPVESLLTKHEVADLVRVSTRTVGNWMADAVIPYFRIGRVVRFDRTKVLQALDEFRIDSR